MPCSDQSTTCDQPPGCASSRRPPPETATTATSKSTPLRPVCVNATSAAVRRERARDVDRLGVVGERQLGAARRVDREQRVALVAAGVAGDHPALLAGRGQRGGDALARERDLLVQAVGRDAPELQEPGDIGQVAELARGQVPRDRGRADLEIALDHEAISPRATRASDEESSPP